MKNIGLTIICSMRRFMAICDRLTYSEYIRIPNSMRKTLILRRRMDMDLYACRLLSELLLLFAFQLIGSELEASWGHSCLVASTVQEISDHWSSTSWEVWIAEAWRLEEQYFRWWLAILRSDVKLNLDWIIMALAILTSIQSNAGGESRDCGRQLWHFRSATSVTIKWDRS